MASKFSYGVGSVIHGEGVVKQLEFHSEGRYFVIGTEEAGIHLVDALTGEEKKKVFCKSSGLGHMKYTHHEMCVIVSSDQRSAELRYLSLFENRYLRNFQGHQAPVTSISMSPIDDLFLTAGEDHCVFKWDLSSPNETMRLKIPGSQGHPIVSYDSSGLVFGVLTADLRTNAKTVRLFDARQTDGGPFQVISPTQDQLVEVLSSCYPNLDASNKQRAAKSNWLSMQFSSDGSHIVVNTDDEYIWLLDGFRPDVLPKVVGPRKNESHLRLGAAMSTDCKYVVSGNDDNELVVFDAASPENAKPLINTMSGHLSTIGCIAFNPRYDMFVSGCVNTALWVPQDVSPNAAMDTA